MLQLYVHDIIVYPKIEQQHEEHLAHVLTALSEAILKKRELFNLEESEFFKNNLIFLCQVLDSTTKNVKEMPVTRIA